MRLLIYLASFIFSTLSFANSQKVPDQFQGTWRIDCSDPDDLYVIQITSEQVNFWETVGDILMVEIIDDRNIVLELNLLNEGLEWVADVEFQFKNGKLIQNPYDPTSTIIRSKCLGNS